MRSMDLSTRSNAPTPHEADDGSAVQWELLYEELGERVFRLLHRMLGDPEEAADVTHDAFVRIHLSRRQFAERGPLHAWAFRIAANLGRDALRRRAVRRRALDAAHADGPTEHDAASTRGSGPQRLGLARALNQLDAAHRAVLLLHDVDGYTHKEIAEMLNVAVGTSKARLSRARGAVRSTLRTLESGSASTPTNTTSDRSADRTTRNTSRRRTS